MNLELLKQLIFFPLAVSFFIALITKPLAIKIGERFQLVDGPKKRKHPAHTHQGVIPRCGGLSIWVSIFITNPLGGIINFVPWIAIIVGLFWIVFLANTVNWSKGFDGQLPGIVVIACLTIAIFSLRYSADIPQWPIAILASITAGAYLGFLPFNFYPQKIMPGYSGGALAGFMIAILTILSTSKILTSMVVLGVPFIDAIS